MLFEVLCSGYQSTWPKNLILWPRRYCDNTPCRYLQGVWGTYNGYKVGMRHIQGVWSRYEVGTSCIRQVWDNYKGYKAGKRHLQGVWGGYKAPTRSLRWVQGSYNGYDICTRVYGGCEATKRGTMQVQGTYKEYEVGMSHLQQVQDGYKAPTRAMRWVQGRYKGTRHL